MKTSPRSPLSFACTLLLCGPSFAYKPGGPVPEGFRMPEPLPLEQAAAGIRAAAGFRVELVAAEPLVMDPVNLDWGPDGRLWVVEMADYPLGIDGRPGGRVRFLEDPDGDGRYDRSTLFLDGLKFPTSVKAWRDGVLVTTIPDILFAADRDGDGKAEVREVLYTGFGDGNPQHIVNGFTWGLDNWIHVANGDSNGKIRSRRTGEVIDISGRDLKIHPATGGLETLTGRTQHGRCRDDWGNWFGCSNSKPMFHFVLPDHYLRRNPHVKFPSGVKMVPAQPLAPPVFPLSTLEVRYNEPEKASRITSACGLSINRDTVLGAEIAGNAFVCEPVHNLVHRQLLKPQGASFSGTRAPDEQASEFLASRDHWFRPTAARTGPDGALWVVDMHRYVIEHPEWIPDWWLEVLDLRAGEDRGRIYRVTPANGKTRPVPRLDTLAPAELVPYLESPNGWQRDTAQEVLVERQDAAAAPLVERLAAESANPLGRLHALGTLDGLGALTPQHVARAMKDPHPGVRRHAVRLSEKFADSSPELLDPLLALENDIHPPLLMQLAFTLGEWNHPEAAAAVARMMARHRNDQFLLAALKSSAVPHLAAVIADSVRPDSRLPAEVRTGLMAMTLGKNNDDGLALLLRHALREESPRHEQFTRLAQLTTALEASGTSLADLGASGPRELQQLLGKAKNAMAAAPKVAADPSAPLEERMAAVALLGRSFDGNVSGLDSLAQLLDPQTPATLQAACVRRIGQLDDRAGWALLVDRWSSLGPATRRSALDTFLGRPRSTALLVEALERGTIPAAALDIARRDRLLNTGPPERRERARKVLGASATPDREQLLARYNAVAGMKGNPAEGKRLFAALCATCHRIGDTGRHVGPDLKALTDKSVAALLTAIVLPNKAVEDKFLQYEVTLTDGSALAGMVQNETGNSLTVVTLDGTEHVVLRSRLASMRSTGRSLMPEGLEAALDPRQMADLHAFLVR